MTSASGAAGHLDLPGVAIRDVDVADFPPGATYGPCVLPDFEFVWLFCGEATWEWETQGQVSLLPGQLLLARPALTSRFVWDRHRPTRHAFVHFRTTYVPPSFGALTQWPLVRPLDEPLDSLCSYLLWLATSDLPEARRRMDEVLALLVGLFVRGPLPATVPDENGLPVHVRRVADYVQRVWSESERPLRPVTVAELAEAAGISGGHLSRLFRARFGTGPVATIERIRLGRAATLLARSNLNVTAVAEACGFANPYHFSRRFHGAYGHSPRDHRRSASAVYQLDEHNLRALARYIWSDHSDL